MNKTVEDISKIKLVPVIKLNDPEKAVPLCTALKKGGLPVAEITFRAAGADKAISNVAKAMPDVLVGAGTIVKIEQVKKAVDAGAKFIISPGFDPFIVEYCLKNNILILPGCSTASELCIATRLGLEAVKFFPAEASGGIKTLKAFSGPFPEMKFIPTGGISEKNVCDYLSLKYVLACGGSWMSPLSLIEDEKWDEITEISKQAISLIK